MVKATYSRVKKTSFETERLMLVGSKIPNPSMMDTLGPGPILKESLAMVGVVYV